jgi:hypothetical protein
MSHYYLTIVENKKKKEKKESESGARAKHAHNALCHLSIIPASI